MREPELELTYQHVMAVMLPLVEPWYNTDRIVCVDSFFSYVYGIDAMFEKGLRFSGVIKTSKKGYPLQYLSHLEKARKRGHVSMTSRYGNKPDLMAFMWIDRDRR